MRCLTITLKEATSKSLVPEMPRLEMPPYFLQ